MGLSGEGLTTFTLAGSSDGSDYPVLVVAYYAACPLGPLYRPLRGLNDCLLMGRILTGPPELAAPLVMDVSL